MTATRSTPNPRSTAQGTRRNENASSPRLNLGFRLWLPTFLLVFAVMILTPPVWKTIERFDTPHDYRIPYTLSRDYWLFERNMARLQPKQIPVLGDSVIWGEYVSRDGTLSHYLNRESGQTDRYVNAGVNGLFPLALEGLVRHYGGDIRNRRVIVHCNLLWMTSSEADLSSPKEQTFNHPRLVPQFTTRIPCYRKNFSDRASIVMTRGVPFFNWVAHIQNTSFDRNHLHAWTLADDGLYPPSYPNAMAAPWKQLRLKVPDTPETDPERGVDSPRHKPWSTHGEGTRRFEWVPAGRSLQLNAFLRLVELLRERRNDVLVVIGPFNTHIMAPDNLPGFTTERDAVRDWLRQQRVPTVSPPTLESTLYGDSSHPLTEGYHRLAEIIHRDPTFQEWLNPQFP